MTTKSDKYFKKKGIMSVIDAVRIAYEEVPNTFYGYQIADKVKRLTGRPAMYDDSALRKMRLLRQPKYGEIDFECISIIDSYYEKLLP